MRPRPLPPSLSTHPFVVRDALPLVSPERLRRRDLLRPARGLRAHVSLAGLPPPVLLAGVLGPNQHFSHTTAAALWGMPVPAVDGVHTTTIGTGSVTRRDGFVGHRITAERARVAVLRGIRVSDRVDAWAECATLLSVDELVAAGDHLVGPAGCDLDDLRAAADRRRGQRGVRALCAALDQVRVGSESPRETRLRLQLMRERFRLPLLNCAIHDADDRFVARPDIIFGRERVCVEYDGDHHRTNRTTYRDDKRRREALADAGWTVLYLSDDDLRGPHWAAFVGRLRRALARGEASRRRPAP
ncbi:DUF559 domain-containing protein [Frondihabitans sp. PhB188]|uniref:DUF559 domain-containing protein n=1 Tax=Frondihabitans sp. PhB188 TaxID=2485200 RepID=UPI000F4820E7|nr:DUF559 domain-containing protein [Frondihabitans sp. PhB188]